MLGKTLPGSPGDPLGRGPAGARQGEPCSRFGIPRLFLSQPDYSFPTNGGIPVGDGINFLERNPTSVAVGDIDEDGDPDIIIGHYDELNRIHRNDQASGGFDVFGEDIAKLKRVRKRGGNSAAVAVKRVEARERVAAIMAH